MRRAPRGFALVGVMMVLFLLTGLIAALVLSGQTEVRIARNYEARAKAQSAAEAGLNHALAIVMDRLTQYQSYGYASPAAAAQALLKGPDNAIGTTALDADNGSLENLGTIVAQRIPRPPARRALAFDTSYEARVFDEDNPARGVTLSSADLTRIKEDGNANTDANRIILVRAVGYGPNSAQTTLEAAIVLGSPGAAIVVNGNLTISGNMTIAGSAASVQANGNLTVSGSPTIGGDLVATGTYTQTGSPTVGGAKGGGYPAATVPNVQASDYLARADYLLKTDGKMYTAAGALVCNGSGTGCNAKGWSFASSRWTLNKTTFQNGTYYAYTNVTTAANVGSAASPIQFTLICAGSITLGSNVYATAASPGLFLVAQGDLSVTGGWTQSGAEAQILVREQLSLASNAKLLGRMIVQNVTSVSTLVTTNVISGNSAGMTYNGSLGGASGAPTVLGWQTR
jgi:Tfp pilus assembly protein PilX